MVHSRIWRRVRVASGVNGTGRLILMCGHVIISAKAREVAICRECEQEVEELLASDKRPTNRVPAENLDPIIQQARDKIAEQRGVKDTIPPI